MQLCKARRARPSWASQNEERGNCVVYSNKEYTERNYTLDCRLVACRLLVWLKLGWLTVVFDIQNVTMHRRRVTRKACPTTLSILVEFPLLRLSN